MKNLAAFLSSLPTQPGVYRMLDKQARLLYVGKAKNLKNRISSYFNSSDLDKKTMALLAQVEHIEFTLVNKESDALLLENNFIKQYKPRYNVLLKDDKNYLYLLLDTHHDYPRLDLTRHPEKKRGKTFGPFPNASAVRESLSLIQKLFQLRQCNDTFFKHRTRPCLQYQIHRCTAPCVARVSKSAYAEQVAMAELFLDGKNDTIIDELVIKMKQASTDKRYEQAAQYRDTMAKLRSLQLKQSMVAQSGHVDVLHLCQSLGKAAITVVSIRAGRVLGHKTYFPTIPSDLPSSAIMAAFLPQYYMMASVQPHKPNKIISGIKLEEKDTLTAALSAILQHTIVLTDFHHANYKGWLSMALTNAQYDLGQQLNETLTAEKQLLHLQQALSLTSPIERIECFDISHTSGESTMASCVVFAQSGLYKKDYRRYTITDITPGDDYAAMRQALTKRYSKQKKIDGVLPDLLLIDGGKGQLKQAMNVIDELQLTGLAVLGIAKGEGRKPGLETLFLHGHRAPIHLPPDHIGLHLLQLIRDEAHRFAISGHRAKRAKQALQSPLTGIDGIGPKRRQALLHYFGGMQALEQASIEDISKVPGMSQSLAKKIYQALH